MEWYLKVLRDYTTFSGRARRKEFWMFQLINTLIAVVLQLLYLFAQAGSSTFFTLLTTFLVILYSLFILIPSIAVSVRRLHDIGKSGFWYLIGFIPIVGLVLLIVWFVQDSDPGQNEYGPNPKEVEVQ